MFSAIFLCIWVISDYTHGAMKNVVGKGYSRVQVFLAKHLFGTLITTLMNLVIFLVILIIGLILIGTQHVGSLFFQNLFIKSFPICRTISYYIEAYTLINRSFEFHFMKTV